MSVIRGRVGRWVIVLGLAGLAGAAWGIAAGGTPGPDAKGRIHACVSANGTIGHASRTDRLDPLYPPHRSLARPISWQGEQEMVCTWQGVTDE